MLRLLIRSTCFHRGNKNTYLDTALIQGRCEFIVSGKVNWNLLCVQREWGQVGQVGHGISTALDSEILAFIVFYNFSSFYEFSQTFA